MQSSAASGHSIGAGTAEDFNCNKNPGFLSFFLTSFLPIHDSCDMESGVRGCGMHVRTIDIDGLHVVVCLKFDHRASPSEIAAFKESLIRHDDVIHSLEASGTFDFLIEFALPDYQAYTSKIASLAEPVARLVERFETSFIARRFVPLANCDDNLWVPCRDGLQRVSCREIDWIHAEGDYVRVHLQSRQWLVNMTMGRIWARLDERMFLKLHRSAIVRRDFIDRLTHRDGRWEARFSDGTTQRVAKSHVGHTLKALRGHLSTAETPFSATRRNVDPNIQLEETQSAFGSNSGNKSVLS